MRVATKPIPALPTQICGYETPVPFDENFKFASRLTFTGDSFEVWVQQVLPPALRSRQSNGTQVGAYTFVWWRLPLWYYGSVYPSGFMLSSLTLATTPRRSWLELNVSRRRGQCGFDREVYIPTLRDSSDEVWMSLTPNEIISQRGQLRRMRGKVGVAGCGLGWFVRRTLERPSVAQVTVVERDPDVLRVFGEPLKREFGDRLVLVNADAYQMDWVHFDTCAWDIWPTYGAAAWDSRFQKIKEDLQRRGKTCVGWGDVNVG